MSVSDGTRESLTAVFEAHEALIDRLISENAELRELVRDLLMLPSVPAFDCFGCKYERHHDCECGFKCMLVERAKELGIEVIEVDE